MTMYSRQLLSGSTNGLPIAVTATAIGTGTTVHVALSGIAGFDEVYVWASNIDSADHTLSVGFGGTATGDLIAVDVVIPANSPPIPVLTGQVLQNSLTIVVSADVANKINLIGFVNRIM